MLEGYGPHGSAILVSCVTDNRNRTVADLRHTFSRIGGNMAEAGAVAWQFDRKSYFSFPSSQYSFEKAFDLGVVAGADDVIDGGETIEIIAPVEAFKTIANSLHQVACHARGSRFAHDRQTGTRTGCGRHASGDEGRRGH